MMRENIFWKFKFYKEKRSLEIFRRAIFFTNKKLKSGGTEINCQNLFFHQNQ